MNAPFPGRILRSYQQRAATWLYERDAAFLIAPLGAGKGAAALTALAELIRDGQRRHALVIAPKLVATTVWPQEIASWPHLQHLRVAVLDGSPERRRAAPRRRAGARGDGDRHRPGALAGRRARRLCRTIIRSSMC